MATMSWVKHSSILGNLGKVVVAMVIMINSVIGGFSWVNSVREYWYSSNDTLLVVHQIFLKYLYAKPWIGMQGEVEIPFSSPSFVQIKFHSLIFVKIFLQLHFLCMLSWDSSQIYFHWKNEANPRLSFTTSGLSAHG